MNEKYIKETLKEANKAYKQKEIPIGCIIVKNNKIISRAHNLKEQKHNAIKHAEIIAIEKACKKLKNWHLNDCTMYVSLEPCMMCCGAIIQSRIKKVIYFADNYKIGYINDINKTKNNHQFEFEKIEIEEAKQLLKKFFKQKREE